MGMFYHLIVHVVPPRRFEPDKLVETVPMGFGGQRLMLIQVLLGIVYLKV